MMVTDLSLPEDIIAEILPRVPAKSLLKFKCVSRSWCSLISSKSFIKAQLEHARNAPLADHGTVLIKTYKNNQYSYWHCPVSYLFSQQKIQDVPQCHCEYPITELRTRLVGCCNGLWCIDVDREYFILWNPTTGLSYRLPPVWNEEKILFTTHFGIGYDESNDDYKVLVVVLVQLYERTSGIKVNYLCRLYSLKANSWKTVDDFTDGAYVNESRATHLNGKLHWVTKTGENSFDIVTYDLRSETAESFKQPFSGKIKSPLGVIQGCLVVCEKSKCIGTRQVKCTKQVWIMKEYGVKESWCKLMTLPHREYYNNHPSCSILCMSAVGEILFQLEENLFLYNPETKTNVCTSKHLNRDIYKKIRDSAICVPTLVSPFPHGTKQDEPK